MKLMIGDVTLGKYRLNTSVLILKLKTKYGTWIHIGTFKYIHIHIINVNV